MKPVTSSDLAEFLRLLKTRGLMTMNDLQHALMRSQRVVSYLLEQAQEEGHHIVKIKQGNSVRYGLTVTSSGPIAPVQPIWFVDEDGEKTRWGELTLLDNEQVIVQQSDREWTMRGNIPWFLRSTLFEGFAGWKTRTLRLGGKGDAIATANENLAQFQRSIHSVQSHTSYEGEAPADWSFESQLYAAIAQVTDAGGAFLLGDPPKTEASDHFVDALDDKARAKHHDAMANALVKTVLPPDFSTAWHLAKFACECSQTESLTVKFTPPRSTAAGLRWHDLLLAENLALKSLAHAGDDNDEDDESAPWVAPSRILCSDTRMYLEVVRPDRLGPQGRRPTAPLSVVHEEFIGNPLYNKWGDICNALVKSGRLSEEDAQRVQLRAEFARLIGADVTRLTGLTLFCDDIDADVEEVYFVLAPCTEMPLAAYLPKTDFDAADALTPLDFAPTPPTPLGRKALRMALDFWGEIGQAKAYSREFRRVAAENCQRLGE